MAKFTEEYQITDRAGNPVGPMQVFEADTQKELIAKLKAAHINSGREMYETKRKVKLGTLLEPDADEPIKTFEEVPLSADERLALKKALDDPNQTQAALKKVLKSLGVDTEEIRKMLQEREYNLRASRATDEAEKFFKAHPEYVICDSNNDDMGKYMTKHNLPVTANNFEIAYEELRDILVTQPPQQESVTPAAASSPEITDATTAPSAITEGTAAPEPVPALLNSSSGLSSRGGAYVAPVTPKAGEASISEIRRKLASMSSTEYMAYIKANPDVAKKLDAAATR
jgi:hypothetical protein